MAVKRMDNVGIVVAQTLMPPLSSSPNLTSSSRGAPQSKDAGLMASLDCATCTEIAMMRTPDGHSRLEISRFLAPPLVADHRDAPVSALGYLRVMFTVEDIDDTLARLANAARSSSAKWSSSKARIGSAISGALKEFSSGSPQSSGSTVPKPVNGRPPVGLERMLRMYFATWDASGCRTPPPC